MSGQIPLWGYVAGAVLFVLALFTGMWAGYGRGWEHCWKFRDEEEDLARKAAMARRVHPVYRQPAWEYRAENRALVGQVVQVPPEVAHEAWLAHTEQALAVASPAPDPRTDSQWTADMAAGMSAFLDSLLSEHPATEEL